MARRKNTDNNSWNSIKTKYKISSKSKLAKLAERYEDVATFEEAVRIDPYCIMIDVIGKSFKQADELIIGLFPELECSLERCVQVCAHILKQNEVNGNTRMEARELAKIIWSDYPILKSYVFEAVTTSPDKFYYDDSIKKVALRYTYENELLISEIIKEKSKSHTTLDIDWKKYTTVDGFELTSEQSEVLRLICNNDIIMLNGSAGTGKSSAMKALVQMATDNGYDCTILAPTGIAAKRIADVTNHHASTIHKFVLSRKSTMGDLLIVDEMSMVGVSLLGMLFRMVEEDTKIVFICDESQLASISCGNIVQDIIDSKTIETVNLTKVFRYGVGGIATVATDVRMGKAISDDNRFDDYKFINVSNSPLDDIMTTYSQLRTQYEPDEIMILSPFNVRSAGTYAINSAIQSRYNDSSNIFGFKKQDVMINFRIGDRVVNTENNYEHKVMNGDIGIIRGYDSVQDLMRIEFDNNVVEFERADMYKLLLGYSISVHKSQGSQAKAVIVVADKSHGFFLTRNLLYVALSRAQEQLVFIGDLNTVNKALYVEENKIRNTWLKEMLIK